MTPRPSDRDIGINLYGGPQDEVTIYDDRLATLFVVLLVVTLWSHHLNR